MRDRARAYFWQRRTSHDETPFGIRPGSLSRFGRSKLLRREQSHFLHRGIDLPLFFFREHRYQLFQLLRMLPVGLRRELLAFRRERDDSRAAVVWTRLALDQSVFLQAVDSGRHRAAGEQHLLLDLRDGEWAFVQPRFERREIRKA